MFGTIRKHQQWLWIVIIAAIIVSFVIYFGPGQPSLSGLTGGGQGEFGSFNGKPLTRETLGAFARQAQLAGRLRFGDQVDSPQVRQMGFDVNREMYQRLFVDAKLKEFHIVVSDDAVARWIRQNLKDAKTGAVDYDGFIERLKRFSFTEAEFQRYVRHELGVEHLREVVGVAGQLVTPREAETEFRQENEQAVASAVFFASSNHLAAVGLEPAALSQFFTNRLAAYRIPERTVISYVKWAVTSNHLAAAEATVKQLPDFASRLEAVYQQRGADAFRDKSGNPMAKEAALEEIRRLSIDSQALSLAASEARDFANELYAMEPVKAENLAALAAKRGLTAQDSEPFSGFGSVPGFEDAPELTREAAKLTADQPFTTKPIPGDKAVYLAALRRKVPSEVPAFESVRARVTEDYRRAEALKLARAAGEAFALAATNAVAQGKAFTAVAEEQKAVVTELPPFSLVTTALPGLDPRVGVSVVKDTAFSLKPGAVSRFIASGDGGFVLFLKERRPVDEATVKAGLAGHLETQRRQRQDEAFQDWFRQEFQKSGLAALLKNRDEPL